MSWDLNLIAAIESAVGELNPHILRVETPSPLFIGTPGDEQPSPPAETTPSAPRTSYSF